ncbi:unnamed protein product [Ixodes pacificus]
MGNNVLCDWKNFIREAVADKLASRPPLGGVGEVVQVDESPFWGKRKYNRQGSLDCRPDFGIYWRASPVRGEEGEPEDPARHRSQERLPVNHCNHGQV